MRYDLLNDKELLVFLKNDDPLAFKEIYNRYWKQLFLIANQKIRNKEIAEEMTQNLFVSLWERRYEATILNLKHYLFRSIKFVIINFYKSQIVEEKYISYILGNSNAKAYTADQLILMNDLTNAIDKGIRLLPKKTQQVFKLSREEEFSVKEISKTLNLSEKAVEYHITQSLKAMKLHLKDYLNFILLIIGCNW